METIIRDFLTHKRSFSKKDLSDATLDFYENKIHRVFQITNLTIEDLWNEEKVESAWLKIMGLQVKISTKVKYIISLQQLSDFLVKKKIIEENEARKIPIPTYQSDLILPLTKEEVDICRSCIKKRWDGFLQTRNLLIFNLFLLSGIRHSELTHLRSQDIFENRIVVHKGKGKKSRVVALPKFLWLELFAYAQNFPKNAYIFAGRGGKIATDRFLCAIFKNIQNGTGIHVYPHRLRHTYASHCILAGLDIYTIKEQLGHSDIRTTLSYMAITNERRIQEVQEKVDDISPNLTGKTKIPSELLAILTS